MSDDKFDVIVVGSGLAGSAAAYRLAQGGAEVLVVERGPYPGSKNLSGGVLFGQMLEELIPDFLDEAPVERFVDRYVLSIMKEDSALNVDYRDRFFSTAPYNGFSVLRGKFDRWLADKAEQAGAAMVTNVRVDSLIIKDGKVGGIVAAGEEMLSDVVIAADGANSFLAEQAGLKGKNDPRNLAVGVKELIGLDRTLVEERFGLSERSGTAYAMMGYPTQGICGGAFLYTNIDSISIGLVMHIDHCVEEGISPAEVLEDFLAHPSIAPLIRGGKVLEYGAHMVQEGGMEAMPKIVTDGMLVVGDAAGLGSNNGFAVRGMDYAVASGIYAADAVLEAGAKEDYSSTGLEGYQKRMEEGFVLKDMNTYSGAESFISNKRLYTNYPKMVEDILRTVYTQRGVPKENLWDTIKRARKDSELSYGELGRVVLGAVKNL